MSVCCLLETLSDSAYMVDSKGRGGGEGGKGGYRRRYPAYVESRTRIAEHDQSKSVAVSCLLPVHGHPWWQVQ